METEAWIGGLGPADIHHKVPVGSFVTLCGKGTNTLRNFMRFERQTTCVHCQAAYDKLTWQLHEED